MGLSDNIFEVLKTSMESDTELDDAQRSNLSNISDGITEALVEFLTKCEFRITKLNANVVLEDFSIPPQRGDVLPSVQSIDIPYPAGAPAGAVSVPLNPSSLQNGVLTKAIDISKDIGNLESTGYVYIGSDPEHQESFDVDDESGQRTFTTVKLFRDDIEDLL